MPLPPSAYSVLPTERTSVPPDAWDDWEEDYSRVEQPTTEQARNARLWQDANVVKPTYSILPSSSSRAPPSAALDASTANGPPQLKILKRPSPNPASSSSRASSSEGRARQEKSLAEREKEYAEARRRILGEAVETVKAASSPSPSRRNGPVKGAREGLEKLSLQGAVKRESSPGEAARRSNSSKSASPADIARRDRQSTASSASTAHNVAQSPRSIVNGASAIRAPKGPGDRGFGFGGTTDANSETSRRRKEVR